MPLLKPSAQTPSPATHTPSSTPYPAPTVSRGPSSSEYMANTASGPAAHTTGIVYMYS